MSLLTLATLYTFYAFTPSLSKNKKKENTFLIFLNFQDSFLTFGNFNATGQQTACILNDKNIMYSIKTITLQSFSVAFALKIWSQSYKIQNIVKLQEKNNFPY